MCKYFGEVRWRDLINLLCVRCDLVKGETGL